MPTVLREDGYTFRIYLNDHVPAHAHVFRDNMEARIALVTLDFLSNIGFNERQLRRIRQIAEAHQDELLAAWDQYHDSR